ncbi:GntR family transcriptional regulator [Micromonospora sp. CPCC 205371]|jgi:DNA-binding transcriptional regulator YhcF (GntR family)|nr:GntR family transcriptional regulator [Micromonospora sp. CPCC 205371]
MSNWTPDSRSLFTRVVEDIVTQIREGRLLPGQQLPSAREMAHLHGVSRMTAQRALRELQVRGATYGAVGRGTFVRPDALARLTRSTARSGCTRCAEQASYTAHLAVALSRCHQLADDLDAYTSPDVTDVAAAIRRLASYLAGDLMDHAGETDNSTSRHWHD